MRLQGSDTSIMDESAEVIAEMLDDTPFLHGVPRLVQRSETDGVDFISEPTGITLRQLATESEPALGSCLQSS